MSERNLKRNASENLKPIRSTNISESSDLMVIGGSSNIAGNERLRDKNSHDYLETIRENEQLVMKQAGRK